MTDFSSIRASTVSTFGLYFLVTAQHRIPALEKVGLLLETGRVAAGRRMCAVYDVPGRPLQLGARNGSAAWVKSGLAPGEQVIVYPGAAVRDGARVMARKV